MSGDLRDQIAEVETLAEEANATARRILALLKEIGRDAGKAAYGDPAEALAPVAAPR